MTEMRKTIKPRAVVFFSGQGGACKGLEDAGWDVVRAVDIVPQPHYYKPEVFLRADAIEHFWTVMAGAGPGVRLVWGSPVCKAYSKTARIHDAGHVRQISAWRTLAQGWAGLDGSHAYVIENVEDARPELIDPIMLCGTMFPSLRTRRHRLFESNLPLSAPAEHGEDPPQVKMGRPIRAGDWYHAVGNFSGVSYVRENLGVPWMTREGINQCVPPVYAEHVGRQIIAGL